MGLDTTLHIIKDDRTETELVEDNLKFVKELDRQIANLPKYFPLGPFYRGNN